MSKLPDPPIKLDGFPTCAAGDGREVEKRGDCCAQDGGKPASMQILRRAIHRQIRTCITRMIQCGPCSGIPLNGVRCPMCTWYRGGAMGIGGLAEQLGYAEELEPLMSMVGVLDPGWQTRL